MNAAAPLLASYRRLLDHMGTCRLCRSGSRCQTARDLERAWRDDRRRAGPA